MAVPATSRVKAVNSLKLENKRIVMYSDRIVGDAGFKGMDAALEQGFFIG